MLDIEGKLQELCQNKKEGSNEVRKETGNQ